MFIAGGQSNGGGATRWKQIMTLLLKPFLLLKKWLLGSHMAFVIFNTSLGTADGYMHDSIQ
jgi:hypothetical protein